MKKGIGLLMVALMVLLMACATAENAGPLALSATERGGTWVIRIPAGALAAQTMGEGELPEGVESMVNLLGDTLNDVITARIAVPADGALLLCLRVMDGDACIVVRPGRKYSQSNPFEWQAAEVALDIFNTGALSVTGVSEINAIVPKSGKGKPERVFERDYDKMDIDVYRDNDITIAVLHQDGKTKKDRLTGTLAVGDMQPGIPVRGYVSGRQTVYCCVLTDAELGALVAGSKPVINPVEKDDPKAVPTPEITVSPTLPDLTLDFTDMDGAGE